MLNISIFFIFKAREEYKASKHRQQVEWATTVIHRQYIQWKVFYNVLTSIKYRNSLKRFVTASTIPQNPNPSLAIKQQQSTVHRLAGGSSFSGRNFAVATPNISPMALLSISPIVWSNRSQSNARKGNGQHHISWSKGIVCQKCCPSVPRRLCPFETERAMEENLCRIERPVCRLCRYHQ